MDNPYENEYQSISRDLQALARQLEQEDFTTSSLAAHLKQLASDIENAPFLWYGVNLFQIFNLSALTERSSHVWQQKSRYRRPPIYWLRIAIIFISLGYLLILSQVLAQSFQTAALLHSNLQEYSFLYLWQSGFFDILPGIFTFRWSVTIFLTLLIIYVLSHFLLQWRDANILKNDLKRAETFSDSLESILFRLQRLINRNFRSQYDSSEQRSLQLLKSIHHFVNTFEKHSLELENIISIEQKRLAALYEHQHADTERQNALVDHLQTLSNSFSSSVNQYLSTLNDFQTLVNNLGQESQKFFTIQNEQVKFLSNSSENMENLEKEMGRFTQIQRKISHDLLEATQQNLEKSGDLSNSIDRLNSISRQVIEGEINLQNLLDDQMRANDSWVRSVGQSIDTLTGVLERLQNLLSNHQPGE